MQPSSLVFVVVIVVWAVFLTQYWARRRDHLVTARTVDRFSETMRVLDHKPADGTTETGAKARSYAVSPARAAHDGSAPASPRDDERRGALPGRAQRTADADRHEDLVDETPVWRPLPGEQARRVRRRVRGVTFLVAALVTVVATPLAAFGVLPWTVPVIAGIAIVLTLVWVRHSVAVARRTRAGVADRSRRAVSRRRHAHTSAHDRAHAHRGAPVGVPGRHVDDVAPSRDEPSPKQSEGVYDVAAEFPAVPATRPGPGASEVRAARPAPAAALREPQVDEDDMPLTWDPVPVPRPTYTMKAVAHPVPSDTEPVAEGTAPAQGEAPAYEMDGGIRRAVGD